MRERESVGRGRWSERERWSVRERVCEREIECEREGESMGGNVRERDSAIERERGSECEISNSRTY